MVLIAGLGTTTGLTPLWNEVTAHKHKNLPGWVYRDPVVSVLDYGAVGDGRHDDANSVQRAIDHIAARGGGVVSFPKGNYLLDRQIVLRNNLTLLGTAGTRLIVGRSFASINRPLFRNFTGQDFNLPGRSTADRNIALLDIEIDGLDVGLPNTTMPNTKMRGAILCLGGWPAGSGVENVLVQNCRLHSFAGAGIMLWHSTGIEVVACHFKNFFSNDALSMGSGIDFHAVRRAVVRDNIIYHDAPGLSWHGMVLLDWEAGSSGVTVLNNVITDMNGGDGISCEGNRGAGSNLRQTRIAGNTIRRCQGQGIGVDNCYDVIVEDNVIEHVTGPAILFTGTPIAVIDRNQIRYSGLGGIVSLSGTLQARLRGNQISQIGHQDAQYRGDGINVTNEAVPTAVIEITHNTLSDIDGTGIYQSASGLISANIIRNAGRSAVLDMTLRAAIVGTAPMSIIGNTIMSNGKTVFAISSAASDFPTIRENQISGRFLKDHFYIAYRIGHRIDLSTTVEDAIYDWKTDTFRGRHNGKPPGRWFSNDSFMPP